MNKIQFYVLMLFSCAAAADAAEPKRAHIKMTAGPKRIQRPAVPEFIKTSGARLKGTLDPANYSVGMSNRSQSLSADAQALYATERAWLPSRTTRSSGFSDVTTAVTIALCAPSGGRQREAWNTLMVELGDPNVSGAWREWQDRISNAILESRILGPRVAGQTSLHLKITNDGSVEVGGSRHSPFGQAVHKELRRLADAGVFKIPAVSETTEVHAMVMSGEHPSPGPNW